MASLHLIPTADTQRPLLFGQLGPDIFTLLAGGNRFLYERSLLAVYEEFFRSDLLFPTEAEVVGVIYRCLSEEPGLWKEDEPPRELDRLVARTGRRVRRRRAQGSNDDATGTAIARSRDIYNRLLQTGWLDETSYGLKTTVEMPSGAMRLAEFLCSLKEGAAEQLGGLVIEVRNAIRAVREKPGENALGLNKAARDAAGFGRHLRSVLAALRDIDRQTRTSETLAERLQHYFEDFVERVLLRDYSAITTTAHPYRHRRAILSALEELEDSDIDIAAIADAYREARLAKHAAGARDLVQEDIFRIRRVFEHIEQAFEAIQQHRSRLETRLRNVVRYAGRRTTFLQRSEQVIQRLDAALGRAGPRPEIRGLLDERAPLVAPTLLARPRNKRPQMGDSDLFLASPDPVAEYRRELERAYLARLAVPPAAVSRFLERQVAPFGEKRAADIRIDTIDDFLAFEALRAFVAGGLAQESSSRLGRLMRNRFEFLAEQGDAVSNPWLDCPGFRVRRLDNSITLETGHAR